MASYKIVNPEVLGKIKLPAEIINKALVIDSSGQITSSSVTDTELGHLSGVTSAIQTQIDSKASSSAFSSHASDTNNPHSVTKAQVGLGNVDNTSDANKPISTATQSALDNKADLVAGLIPINQIPPAALERLVVVADQAARFALTTATVQNGDTVKQNDTGVLYFVKDDTNLGNASGYEVYSAGTASSVAYSGITGKPAELTALENKQLDTTYFNTGVIDTDLTSVSASDDTIPSAKAVKSYVDTNIGASNVVGDIQLTTFNAANNQSSPSNVTGLQFAAGTVRGFKALVTVSIDATTDLFEVFELIGIQKASGFDMAVSGAGDNSGVSFSITSAGQVQYTSSNISGFVSNKIAFRASVTNI